MASKKLNIEDIGCPICLEVLIEPITMPCNHRLCKPCYQQNIQVTSIHCPFCKLRIGTWNRKAKDINKLIDTMLWDNLKKQYPEKVEARLKGLSSNSEDELFQQRVSHIISDQGQIGKELEQEREDYELENKQLSEKENRKSEALILKIQKEELARRECNRSQDGLQETSVVDSSPPFHGWKAPNDESTRGTSENEVSTEFLDHQRKIEEQISQTKQDELYAKHIQDNSESPQPSTSNSVIVTKMINKPKMLKQLFCDFSDDSISDVEDTQDIYGQLPDLDSSIEHFNIDNKGDKEISHSMFAARDYKKLDLHDYIDENFINLQKQQERKIRQEEEDEKMARELQLQYEEANKRELLKTDRLTKNHSPLNSKRITPAKRQMSIADYLNTRHSANKKPFIE